MKTYIFSVIGVAILAFIGIAIYQSGYESVSVTASPTGSTFSTAKVAAIVIAPADVTSTSTSILNTDSSDRYIIAEELGCQSVGTSRTPLTGAGLLSLTLTMATSSTATPSVNANTNTLPVITIGTSTPNFVISSSTAATPGTSIVSNIWASGSYLSIFLNATNTAACTVGVRYFGS